MTGITLVKVGKSMEAWTAIRVGPKKMNKNNNSYSKKYDILQLHEYETAPNFIQLIQNLTSDCLLI